MTEYHRRISRVVPFGYKLPEHDDKLMLEIPEELKALKEAIDYVNEGVLSLREASTWLESQTGRKLSHIGLYKIINK